MKTNASNRSGFTLVELLVVVGIIAVLAALLTPAVMRARSAARNTAIKVEIDMLHMAIMNYRNEYGSFPPAVSDDALNSPAVRHLRRLFPRCNNILAQYASNEPPITPRPITPLNAIGSWLGGYTSDPTSPRQPAGSRKRLYDFDQSRLDLDPSRPSYLAYAPPGRPDAPYIYIDAPNYLQNSTTIRSFTLTGGTYFGQRLPVLAVPDAFDNLTQPAFNPDTFQILCAGVDNIFGNDDDLSNFWKGTRREYLDSLQNQ